MTKCPHCEYEDGWGWVEGENGAEYGNVEGSHGEFYRLNKELKRGGFDNDVAKLVGCPCCFKTFIEKN